MSELEMKEVLLGQEVKFGVDWLHPCALHLGELEIDPIGPDGENLPGCPECGCLLDTEGCSWCGVQWIAFGGWSADDIMRPAEITSSGDLMCANCAERTEEEENSSEEFSDDWQDDFP